MKKLFIIMCLLSMPLFSQIQNPSSAAGSSAAGTIILGPKTIGSGANQLPAAASCSGCTTIVSDAASVTDCTVGSGTTPALCRSNGSAWVAVGAKAKGDVGLGNVDNTSDANKPISSATQTALDAKAASSASTSVNGQTCALGSSCTVYDSTKVPTSSVGAASGIASLDSNTKIPAAQLPAPTASTLGGVESNACPSQFVQSIGTDGSVSCATTVTNTAADLSSGNASKVVVVAGNGDVKTTPVTIDSSGNISTPGTLEASAIVAGGGPKTCAQMAALTGSTLYETVSVYDGDCPAGGGTKQQDYACTHLTTGNCDTWTLKGGSPAAGSSGDLQTNGGSVPQSTFIPSAKLDTTGTLGTDDTKVPSQKAVKTYADTKAASNASTTVNGQTCALGGSCTVSAGSTDWPTAPVTVNSQTTATVNNDVTETVTGCSGGTPYYSSCQGTSCTLAGVTAYTTGVSVVPDSSTKASFASRCEEAHFQTSAPVRSDLTFQVGAITDSPGVGSYGGAQSVTLGGGSSGDYKCYTANGSTPAGTASSCSTGTHYTGAFTSPGSTFTLKSIGYKANYAASAEHDAVYTIAASNPAFVVAHPLGTCSSEPCNLTAFSSTSGNRITLFFSGAANFYGVSMVDDLSNAYTPLLGTGGIPDGTGHSFYAFCLASSPGGSRTITLSNVTNYGGIVELEHSSGSCTLDGTPVVTGGTGTALSSGSVTASAQPDTQICAFYNSGGGDPGITWTNGATTRLSVDDNYLVVGDQLISSNGSKGCTGTLSWSTGWSALNLLLEHQ